MSSIWSGEGFSALAALNLKCPLRWLWHVEGGIFYDFQNPTPSCYLNLKLGGFTWDTQGNKTPCHCLSDSQLNLGEAP